MRNKIFRKFEQSLTLEGALLVCEAFPALERALRDYSNHASIADPLNENILRVELILAALKRVEFVLDAPVNADSISWGIKMADVFSAAINRLGEQSFGEDDIVCFLALFRNFPVKTSKSVH